MLLKFWPANALPLLLMNSLVCLAIRGDAGTDGGVATSLNLDLARFAEGVGLRLESTGTA